MLDELRRATGAPIAGLPALPPRAMCRGVEFVEFAMDEASASAFETTLRGLGFAHTGAHRSKAVSRWQQGDINIVVNSDKEGFAHSFNITHGPSVCAIALRVDDAAATVERAVKLLDTPFTQRVGPGELNIPSVRGLGGSLLYFVDGKSELGRLWDVDFEPTGEKPAGVGLTSVDHISQSMLDEELLTWLLFYTSLLDVEKSRVADVIDPGGIVQSQVIRSPDSALRLILNASQSRRTLAARFLTDFFGSGVQHIALATDDIFAALDGIRKAGIAMLPIPENYYDDLEARTDLSEEQIDRLKAANVLYDREGQAEFFQAYTVTLEGGFFFEIVQRNGYAGFGAVNASIRLAAQTRLAPNAAMPRR